MMTQYNDFMSSINTGETLSFAQIQAARQTLRSFGGIFVESGSGLTESELRNFLNQRGVGGAEYKQIIQHLDSVGNLIMFFEYSPSPTTHMIWGYIEKE